MSAILFRKNIHVFSLLCMMLMCLAGTVEGLAQDAKFQSQVTPPPVTPVGVNQKKSPKDSVELRQPVADKVTDNYGNLQFVQQPTDLKNPDNVTTTVEYDPATGMYVVHTKIGDNDVVTPFLLNRDEYNNTALRQSMVEYYRQKNAMLPTRPARSRPSIFSTCNLASGRSMPSSALAACS